MKMGKASKENCCRCHKWKPRPLDMKPSKEDVESSVSNDFNGVEVNVGSKHTFPRGGA